MPPSDQQPIVFNQISRPVYYPSVYLSYLSIYRVCQGLRLNEERLLFLSHFWPLLKPVVFFDAVGTVAKIGLSPKPNNHNQVKLV